MKKALAGDANTARWL